MVVLTFCPTTSRVATHESAILVNFGPKITQLHHVRLGDQLEDDDDDGCWRSEFCDSAKYSAQ